MKKYIIIGTLVVVALFGILIFAGEDGNSTNPQSQSASVQNESSKKNLSTIQADMASGSLLVDVRTPEEFSAGHAEGAINLPLDKIQAGTYPSVDKTKPLYLYCRSGNRSAQATKILKENGFNNITDLGALTAWSDLGGKVIK